MNCFYHPHRPAVANCPDCGKGLCSDCASQYTIPICPQCNGQRKNNTVRHYVKDTVIIAAVFLVAYAVVPSQNTERVFTAYMLTCIYGGWVFINRFMPRFLLIFNVNAWLIYFAVKAIVSCIVGFFVTPFVVVYNIVQIIREKQK